MNLIPSFQKRFNRALVFYLFMAAVIILTAWGLKSVERANEKRNTTRIVSVQTMTMTPTMRQDYDAWLDLQICFTDMECEIAYVEAMNETCHHERECEENFDFEAYIADWQEGRQK